MSNQRPTSDPKVFIRLMRDFLGIPDEECAISPPPRRTQRGLKLKTSDVRKECATSPDMSDTANKLASPTTSGPAKRNCKT